MEMMTEFQTRRDVLASEFRMRDSAVTARYLIPDGRLSPEEETG